MRILFAGGGTGGHIYPILAVTEELQKAAINGKIDLDLRYFSDPERYNFLLASNGILVSKIFSAKLRRYFDIRNLFDIPLFFISVIQSFWKVFWFMPDVLFSKGGPGSLPVVLACWFYRVPIIIHESDSAPGLANLMASKFADRIAVSFNSATEFFIAKNAELSEKIALTGNPTRKSLTDSALEQEAAKQIFSFDSKKPLILIIGGSQGSAKINDFMLNASLELMEADIQVLHQTGVNNFDDAKKELKFILENYTEKEMARYKIVPYFEKDLQDAYAAADIIISRAGSGSIFEIAAFGKPSILIPLQKSAQNHQIQNAYEYAGSGAAIVVEEANLMPNIIISQIKKIVSDPEKFKKMSEAAKNFSKPEAAKIISEEIIKLGAN
ncbi:MAG TPA: UDP-N-acetylglucosamine--N-acetylmuramyl-(pentapeptide) pyrophosphoryl-undecaprenol N-acetylglucosamine transferase [Patescibacteria group bacterium]|nr:UDP-N-acetylglucosamine--N-acetylmuramyl-(pentapeptide) pyrophosphoryl-undecaprenol N-acetylglucosamine transferase [Patescibacteria group bacterium]